MDDGRRDSGSGPTHQGTGTIDERCQMDDKEGVPRLEQQHVAFVGNLCCVGGWA